MERQGLAALLAFLCCAGAGAAGPAKNLGVVSCASSLCHGSVSPWKDSNILQNEYVTWSRVDKHATKAYHVLLTERSQRIVRNLGLTTPAQETKICLDCHAYNPPPALRGERFKVADGVSCEACHGASENWIASHTAPEATHADNVAKGLYPLSDPVAQARLCLSCHFGDRNRFVTHRMMGAGHPRMSFELDTFSQTQPPHFVIDDDWRRRKGSWDEVRVWAVGQALAAQELLDVLLDDKRGRDGLFPELVVFDCYACHHPMSDKRWTPATGTSPGRIRLNDSNLLMVRQIAHRTLPAPQADAFDTTMTGLHRAVAGDGGDPIASVTRMRAMLAELVKAVAARDFDTADVRAIAASLVREAADGRYRDYAGAEQATMAISSVMNWLARHGGLANVRAANAALDRVYESVRNDERYQPQRFREAMAALAQTLGS
ncbi:MAG TPA: multiheme c-type cytochrome [Usitatibacter sp.]|nr:multiheme c-type cytochrome [Usitatibacter sp.]